MLPAHGRGIEHHLAARMAAENGPALDERDSRGTATGGLQFEERHGAMHLMTKPARTQRSGVGQGSCAAGIAVRGRGG
jgi:hypothetical protein